MSTRRLMQALGYTGLLPFYAFALALWFPGNPLFAISGEGFVLYGVVILSFLGGTLWGYAVRVSGPAKHWRLILSNLVALFAAAVGLLGDLFWAAALLAVGQLVLLSYERAVARSRGWYMRLRTRLVAAVMPAYGLFLWGWYTTA